ncbi:MAG: cysteate synthase [Phycisphaerae bacterium]|nr:cysteate synthase [Phycisphaerae bacterium]
MGAYRLACPACGNTYPPAFSGICPLHDSLLHTEYTTRSLRPAKRSGLWRYLDWMPCDGFPENASGPVTYRSEGLARELGLEKLYISFNGYWPENGAFNTSATFKDYEAQVTLQRMREFGVTDLVVASAGNTARAFVQAAQKTRVPIIAVVPGSAVAHLWSTEKDDGPFTLISVRDSDYFEAIDVANRLCKARGLVSEGGARNVGRRDGMASIMYDAAFTIKDIPQHYFQSIGSGTGAIAAFEGARRLVSSGMFENARMRLHLSQNLPFVPIVNAYSRGLNVLDSIAPDDKAGAKARATMLSNRRPPYSVPGGTYDVLHASGGAVYAVSNEDTEHAQLLFEGTEGVDIVPEAGVAVASLARAVHDGEVPRGETVLLNVTGGGVKRLHRDRGVHSLKPAHEIRKDISDEELKMLPICRQNH